MLFLKYLYSSHLVVCVFLLLKSFSQFLFDRQTWAQKALFFFEDIKVSLFFPIYLFSSSGRKKLFNIIFIRGYNE
jgi:hypothetical protein